MPFGKYKGYYLVFIPEHYYTWYKRKGFPKGKLGRLMQEMDEIKLNGLEDLLIKLIRKQIYMMFQILFYKNYSIFECVS